MRPSVIQVQVKVPLKVSPELGSPFQQTNTVPVVKNPPRVPVKDRPEQGSPFTGYSHHPGQR